MARVANALLDPRVRAPELSAVNESTVAALYAHIDRSLAIELDYAKEKDLPEDFDQHHWRRRIAACQGEPNDEFYVEWNSTDSGDWDVLLESLQDQVLWDADWDMPELFMDEDPEVSQVRKDQLGILEDYYTDPPPDLRDADVPAAFAVLEKLTENS